MWTDITRAHHARAGLALPSDLTDGEWAVLEPFFPPPSHVGRPRKWPLRRVVEAILFMLRGGLPWRMLPPGFPPVSTVRRWYYLWRDNGLWQSLNHYLLMASREANGREASPSAGVIDSQSVKTTESGGPRGYDAGKKVKGRKRHILTDTEGNLVHAVIDMVKAQGFRHWVILKPAMIMEDIVPPQAGAQFPSLRELGLFETSIAADTGLDWIAAKDIGAFAAAAFADPDRFHGHEIDLAAETFTLPEVSAKMSKAAGKPVSAVTLSKEEALAKPYGDLGYRHETWNNVEGYKVDLDAVRSWGIPLTTLDEFIEQHCDKFAIG